MKQKLLSDGKIPAIKLYRKLKPGAGLAEAKAYVDRIEGKSSFASHRKKPQTSLSPLAVAIVTLISIGIFLIFYLLAR